LQPLEVTVLTELGQLPTAVAPQFHQSLHAAVPLPASVAQEAVLPVVVAEAAVQPTAAALAAALPAEKYPKCLDSSELGQSLDQYYGVVQPLPDSSR
jgi:hypothetical protein